MYVYVYIYIYVFARGQECKRGETLNNTRGERFDDMRISEGCSIRFGSSVSSANRPSLSFAYSVRKNVSEYFRIIVRIGRTGSIC